jgi:hypothetical protein
VSEAPPAVDLRVQDMRAVSGCATMLRVRSPLPQFTAGPAAMSLSPIRRLGAAHSRSRRRPFACGPLRAAIETFLAADGAAR